MPNYSDRFCKGTFLVLASMLVASNAVAINCNYQVGGWSQDLQQVYYCEATATEDGNPDITTVTGIHNPGKSAGDVQLIQVINGQVLRVYKLPSNLATFFPNLRGLLWQNSKLETIKATDLQPFPNLVYLDVSYNQIRHLDGDLLKYNPHLTSFAISNNFIDSIGKGLFNGFIVMNYAYFYGNICTVGLSHTLSQYYTIADMQEDLEHLCGPLIVPEISGVCSNNCTSRFNFLEAETTAIEASLTAAWYEKLKWFLRTAFGLC